MIRRLGSAALVLVGLVWILPTAGLLMASLRTPVDNRASGWWRALLAPGQLTLDNYRRLLDDPEMVGAFWNTVAITVPSTALVVVLGAAAAYALAWGRFPGREACFYVIVALIVVPLQVALIPVAGLYERLGVFGTIPGVVAFHVAFGLPFAVFLLRNFFAGLPSDLVEAARMDGAGEWSVLRRVVLPLAWPALAALAIFQFLWVWNDLLVGLVFAGDSAPLTVAIRDQTRQFASNLDVIGPGAFVSMLVPLAVFFAFQRYFVSGILAGSVR